MAQQLLARGECVALLVVIDQEGLVPGDPVRGSWPATVAAFLGNLPFWIWYDLFQTRPAAMLTRLRLKLRGLVRALASGPQKSNDADLLFGDASLPEAWLALVGRHDRAWLDYVPRPYPGRLTLMKARAQPLFRFSGRDLGWSPLATGGVEVMTVPGSHDNILSEPYVRSLARRLEDRLREARTEVDREARPSVTPRSRRPQAADPSGDGQHRMHVDGSGGRKYVAVVNIRGQYSIWPADREVAPGWSDAGKSGTKADCLTHIGVVWTDLPPAGRASRLHTTRRLAWLRVRRSGGRVDRVGTARRGRTSTKSGREVGAARIRSWRPRMTFRQGAFLGARGRILGLDDDGWPGSPGPSRERGGSRWRRCWMG